MELATVKVSDLTWIADRFEKIENYIFNQTEKKSLLSTRWVPFRKFCEELDVDPKTGRKYIKGMGYPTTKIGSKIYVDIEAVRASLDSNAKK